MSLRKIAGQNKLLVRCGGDETALSAGEDCCCQCINPEDCPSVYVVCYGCADIDDLEAYNAPCKEKFFSGPNAIEESEQYIVEECLSLVITTVAVRCCLTEDGKTQCGSECGDFGVRCTRCDICQEESQFLGPYDTVGDAQSAGNAAANECGGSAKAVRFCALVPGHYIEVCCPTDEPP